MERSPLVRICTLCLSPIAKQQSHVGCVAMCGGNNQCRALVWRYIAIENSAARMRAQKLFYLLLTAPGHKLLQLAY